ncbi:hypothetical protein ABK040_015475 [Willaertia magna]
MKIQHILLLCIISLLAITSYSYSFFQSLSPTTTTNSLQSTNIIDPSQSDKIQLEFLEPTPKTIWKIGSKDLPVHVRIFMPAKNKLQFYIYLKNDDHQLFLGEETIFKEGPSNSLEIQNVELEVNAPERIYQSTSEYFKLLFIEKDNELQFESEYFKVKDPQGVGIFGIFLIIFVPVIMLLSAIIGGYAMYRNMKKVKDEEMEKKQEEYEEQLDDSEYDVATTLNSIVTDSSEVVVKNNNSGGEEMMNVEMNENQHVSSPTQLTGNVRVRKL